MKIFGLEIRKVKNCSFIYCPRCSFRIPTEKPSRTAKVVRTVRRGLAERKKK